MDALMKEAVKARTYAYVPYSKFAVGAALLLEDGTMIRGANIENASYGLANCAERTVLFKAYSEGNRRIRAIAVVGDTPEPIAPCGACRQVMVELCEPAMPVYLSNLEGKWTKTSVQALLPGYFKAEDMYDN